MQKWFSTIILACQMIGLAFPSLSQNQTVGLFHQEAGTAEGYILWAPIQANDIYLMNNCGQIVHSWNNGLALGNSVYLMEDGSIIRTAKEQQVNSQIQVGGGGQRIQRVSWDGELEWDYLIVGDTFRAHHDIEPLPNGNVLVLVWELKNKNQCLASGRDPNLIPEDHLYSEYIVELEPTGPASARVVWEWHLWDHLVQSLDPAKSNFGLVAQNPGKLDINFINRSVSVLGDADWIHANAIDYNPFLDQIMISSQRLGEIYIIDHSTTTVEAVGGTGGKYGKGGDFLYRWGNPQAYQRGDSADQQLWGQHDCRWIGSGLLDAGRIMVFNNGFFSGRNYSSVEIIDPPQTNPGVYPLEQDSAYGPQNPFWLYTAPVKTDFYSFFISGAQRLENGNTLICSGANGTFFEVDYNGKEVWRYVNPQTEQGIVQQGEPIPISGSGLNGNIVFRAEKYAIDYSAFSGRDLTPKGTIEQDPIITDCGDALNYPPSFVTHPNPAITSTTISIQNVASNYAAIRIYDAMGRKVWEEENPGSDNPINVQQWQPGLYIVHVGNKQWGKLVKVEP